MKGTGKTGTAAKPLVAILMGSDSDWGVMVTASERLTSFGVAHEAHVLSAHRSPENTARFARDAKKLGYKVFICAAGAAAHLAGAVSAQTTLPVLGVPLDATGLGGLDALLATVQMPAGIPVGTLAIGKAGADNAAILAVQILALADAGLSAKLDAHKASLAKGVAEKDRKLQEALAAKRSAGK